MAGRGRDLRRPGRRPAVQPTTISGSSRMRVFIGLKIRQAFSAFSTIRRVRSTTSAEPTTTRGRSTISVIIRPASVFSSSPSAREAYSLNSSRGLAAMAGKVVMRQAAAAAV